MPWVIKRRTCADPRRIGKRHDDLVKLEVVDDDSPVCESHPDRVQGRGGSEAANRRAPSSELK